QAVAAVEMWPAGVTVMERGQLLPDPPRDRVLRLAVVDARDRLADHVLEGDAGDLVAPLAVDGIAKAGVILVERDQIVFTGRVATLVLDPKRPCRHSTSVAGGRGGCPGALRSVDVVDGERGHVRALAA